MKRIALATAIAGIILAGTAIGSSHKEAPLVTGTPKVDGTDLYMFRSYETGREGYVTFIANYQPLQDPSGGPNFNLMDPKAVYALYIDNDGDAIEDLALHFRFYNTTKGLTVPVDGQNVAVALSNIGPFGASPSQNGNSNVYERYNVTSIRDRDLATTKVATNLDKNSPMFSKAFDNVGNKSIADYPAYAQKHIARIGIDGCAGEGRVFVGQRKEGFAVNLGAIFDLINTNPLGDPDGGVNNLANKNVTSIAVELPISCLTNGTEPVIGAWTTAYLPNSAGKLRQQSRLSAPLVNEVIIGLPDKDKFNTAYPTSDAKFAKYVTNPSLPILIQALYPDAKAPTAYPRNDLVAAFLTGVEGLNKPANVRPSEMMRLNTSIAPKAAGAQETLGVLANDTSGFPNGRRPGDDVVDIELRVAMGALLPEEDAPSGKLPFTDGAALSATEFKSVFPYLNDPIPGAVN